MSEMEDASNDPESECAVVDQEPQMISWRETDVCEANGIILSWGEYFVFEGKEGAGSDDDSGEGGDDEEECTASEAEEVSEEEVEEEERRAERDASDDDTQRIPPAWLGENDADTATYPSLLGLPDTLLENIINLATTRAPQVCTLERVCKRIRRMAMKDDFWARQFFRFRIYGEDQIGGGLSTRELSLHEGVVRQIRKYQKGTTNEIIEVLGGSANADAFRDVAAGVVSQMICEGSEMHFRLRGDTVWYLAEMLQANMIRKLANALLFAIHNGRTRVQGKDMEAAICGMEGRGWSCRVSQECQLMSDPGTVLQWREEMIQSEAGRRIIRRIAYVAGIVEMSSEAFDVAESELLRTMGLLLVDAIGSAVEMGKSASYLGDNDRLVCGVNICSLDMFKVPPPPFCASGDEGGDGVELVAEPLYTIVPGLIRASAERRNIIPYHVYGCSGLWDAWVPSSGFTSEEEIEIEESYYYREPFDDSSFDGDEEKGEGNTDDGTESQSNEEDFDSSDDMDWEELNDISHVEARMPDGQDGWYLT